MLIGCGGSAEAYTCKDVASSSEKTRELGIVLLERANDEGFWKTDRTEAALLVMEEFLEGACTRGKPDDKPLAIALDDIRSVRKLAE